MPRRLLEDGGAEFGFSPFVDVVANLMAALLVILMIYMILVQPCSCPQLKFIDTELPAAMPGRPYSFAFPVVGGCGQRAAAERRFSIVAGTLPPWLRLQERWGLLHGTPPAAPSADRRQLAAEFKVRVDDDESSAEHEYRLFLAPPAIPIEEQVTLDRQEEMLPAAEVGVPYEAVIGAHGGVEPYRWSAEMPLAAGLRLEEGRIVGTPAVAGSWAFGVRVSYGDGRARLGQDTIRWDGGSQTRRYRLEVRPECRPDFQLILPLARVGERFQAGLVQLGSSCRDERATWSGSVPGLAAEGFLLRGTPTTAGRFEVGYVVHAHGHAVASGREVLRVLPALPEPRVGPASFHARVGQELNVAIPHTGLVEPCKVEIDPHTPLPEGLELVDGHIVGTPTRPGSSALRLELVDALAHSQGGTVGLWVGARAPGIVVKNPQPLHWVAGQAFELTLAAEGGDGGSYEWQAARLPPGVKQEGGMLSGLVAGPGSWEVQLGVKDVVSGEEAQVSRTLRAAWPEERGPRILTKEAPHAVVGHPYTLRLSAAGGVGMHRWEASGTLPPGLLFSAERDGVTGLATQVGSSSLTVTVTDQIGQKAEPKTLSIQAVDPTLPVREELGRTRDELRELEGRMAEREQLLREMEQEWHDMAGQVEWVSALLADEQARAASLFEQLSMYEQTCFP